MANLTLFISGLRSRRIRSRVYGRDITTRSIGQPLSTNEVSLLDRVKGVLGGIISGTVKLGGWLWSGTVAIGFSAVAVVNWLREATDFVMGFNWNATDAELDRQFKTMLTRLVGLLGGTLGNLAGYVVCGLGTGTLITVINEPLGLYLLKEVGEEALDEFLSNLRLLLRASLTSAVQAAAIATYKSVRRWIKSIVKDPDSSGSRLSKKIFGTKITEAIKVWGEEGTKPWSFRIAKENKIESIENPYAEEFVEEFVDEFGDACWDAFYIIASGIDSWVLQQRLDQEAGDRRETGYEITLNRQAEDERIILSGTEDEVRTQAMTIMNTHTLIRDRDVGMWVGEPLRHDARQKVGGILLRIQLFNWPTPPFFRSNELLQRVTITIPGVKRSKLDWQTIKDAVGGNTGYLWGRWLATANLVDENDRFAGKLKIWGGSEAEAERRINRCLELSEYEMRTLSIKEERREGIRRANRQQYKASTRVYPAYCIIINSQKVLREDLGEETIQGTYRRSQDKILLWVEEKPDDFEETIQRLLRNTPG